MEEAEKSEKEAKIRAITKMYYSNPSIQKAMLEFAKDRETVPRYFEGFGKRPDIITYPSDIIGLVNKGATSFHTSEEIWEDALKINSDLPQEEINKLRKCWDLLIDIDSKYLEYSKIAAMLVIRKLEEYGIKKYGIKFSGSKGFHIIVSGKAFPEEFYGAKRNESFPEWPRAICDFLINSIRPDFNRIVGKEDIVSIQKRTNLTEGEVTEVICPQCGKQIFKKKSVTLECPVCKSTIQRLDFAPNKRKLRCMDNKCAGYLEIIKEEEVFYCNDCKISNLNKINLGSKRGIEISTNYARETNNYREGFQKGLSDAHKGGLDLVLVAPRHLFRMPYSLHEKTRLSSVVISKEELENFSPKDADPLKVVVRNYLPDNEEGEARRILSVALDWKKSKETEEEKVLNEKYKGMGKKTFEKIEFKDVTEEMFPKPIKKLLNGLEDGKKRGLFILITFLRAIGFPPEQINNKVREWNKLNKPPLKEGYIKSQIDWNLKQKKQIMPPNYDNPAFYKDLNLLDEEPKAKNPVSEIARRIKEKTYG